ALSSKRDGRTVERGGPFTLPVVEWRRHVSPVLVREPDNYIARQHRLRRSAGLFSTRTPRSRAALGADRDHRARARSVSWRVGRGNHAWRPGAREAVDRARAADQGRKARVTRLSARSGTIGARDRRP